MPVAVLASDVVIVGAGLSGLSSALHLLDLGVTRASSITVLEGRSRVGGRLLAHEGVDVGGAWCWPSSHHDVPALASRFGVQAFDQHDDGLNVVDYGTSTTRTKQRFDSAKIRFEGGTAAITDALASHVRGKGVNVQLDCIVNHVSTAHNDGVIVEGSAAGEPTRWKAKVVFLAIPPRLMLPPLMTWRPSLPPALVKAVKATPTWMASTTKVLVTYPRPFWRDVGMSGNVISHGGGPIQQLYDSCGPEGSEGGLYALCGFVFGDGGGGPPPDDVLRPEVLQQLERIFGSDAKSPLSFSSHRWVEQTLTSGNEGAVGGDHNSMGHPGLRKPFGSGVAGGPPRVWLSAAETDGGHAGLMEGALLAGRRVVEQAVRSGTLAEQRIDNAAEDSWAAVEQSSPQESNKQNV